MNRTLKEATIQALHYTSPEPLQSHLADYLWPYNSARPLRALKGKIPSLNNSRKRPSGFMMPQAKPFVEPHS